jgi:hypothetical protein
MERSGYQRKIFLTIHSHNNTRKKTNIKANIIPLKKPMICAATVLEFMNFRNGTLAKILYITIQFPYQVPSSKWSWSGFLNCNTRISPINENILSEAPTPN